MSKKRAKQQRDERADVDLVASTVALQILIASLSGKISETEALQALGVTQDYYQYAVAMNAECGMRALESTQRTGRTWAEWLEQRLAATR